MAVQVFQPFEIFYDINGRPLDDGFIWVGQPNLDPETNQISVFFDEALTIPATQPIRTRNGFPSNAGAQAQIFVGQTPFSITIKNKNSTAIRAVASVHSSTDLEERLADSADEDNGTGMLGWLLDPTSEGNTLHDRMAQFQISVLDFVPKNLHAGIFDGTNVTALTAYIQDALDYAAGSGTRIRSVFFPSGYYLTSTIFVPEGVEIFGEWHIETTGKASVRFVQASAGDVIRVEGHAVGPRDFWFGSMRNFAIIGNLAFGSGIGINFTNSLGDPVAPQDTSVLSNISIRYMSGGGIAFPDGALPLYVEKIKLLWNEGPGIHLTGGTFLHQSVHFDDISGDGNNGGLIKLSNIDAFGNVLVTNIKSEMRVNPVNSLERQQNCILIENCTDGSCVSVVGGTHISSVPDGGVFKKPGDFISITGAGVPNLDWQGVEIRVRGTDTGAEPNLVSSATPGVAIPRAAKTGRLSNSARVDRITLNATRAVFGTVDSYQNPSVESPGKQVAGTTPGFSLHESDAAADAKTWLQVVSAGELTDRTVSDAGASSIYRRIRRTGATATEVEYLIPVELQNASLQLTNIPTFADNAAALGGGLTAGKVYKTATGELRIVV